MRKIEPRLFWGGLFIMVGALFLAQNLGMLILKDPFWLMVFLFSGSYMLLISFQSKAQWWALIPGFTLLSLAIMIAVNGFMPSSRAAWSSSIILGGIGVGFLGCLSKRTIALVGNNPGWSACNACFGCWNQSYQTWD